MRVLNVNMTINSLWGGGSAERTFQITKHLSNRGIDCKVLTLDIGLTSEVLKALPNVKVISIPCILDRFFVPKISPRVIGRINDLISSVDIIHMIGHWSVMNVLVYIFSRRLGKPYVFCPAGTLVIHGRSRHLKRLYTWTVGKRIIRDASGYVSITTGEIPELEKYLDISDKVVNIPNGVDQRDFMARDDDHFRKKYDLGSHPFVLFVGTFSPIKGPDLILEAFYRVRSKFPDYHLVYAGIDRGLLSRLKENTANFDLVGRVHFIGYIEGPDKSKAYHAADLLVVPSRHEAMSLVALEAGITGTPVLLTDQCGFKEIATFGGGVVMPATVDGLEKGLVEMLEDPSKLKIMGENLKRYIEKEYSWDMIITNYIQLYNQILT